MTLLSIRRLTKTFEGELVLRGVDLDVEAGELIAILGKSGTGKSVLLKTLIGLEPADGGEIRFDGRNLVGLSEKELRPFRRRVSLVFQEGALFDSMSALDNVAYPLRNGPEEPPEEEEILRRARKKLETVGLAGHEDKLPGELSGGMKKRVALARGLVTDPELLLFDEPTSGLDPVNKHRVLNLIASVTKGIGVTALFVTHDLESAFALADRIALLADGRIAVELPTEEFKRSDDPRVLEFLEPNKALTSRGDGTPSSRSDRRTAP